MAQTPLSVVAKIQYGEHTRLKALLKKIGSDVENNREVDFRRTTTYFGRLVVLDNDPHYAPLLLFESQFDGTVDEYLDSLIAAGPGLDAIFGKCVDYPSAGTSDRDAFKEWIRRHSMPVATYYAAYPRLTLTMARANLKLRETIGRELLDRLEQSGRLQRMSPRELREEIQRFVRETGLEVGTASMPFLNFADKLTVRTPPPPGTPVPMTKGWREYLALYTDVRMLSRFAQWLLYTFTPFVVRVVLFPYLFVLRRKEKEDAANYLPPPPVQSLRLNEQFQAVENQINKNQMTHVVEVKPGAFRRTTLHVVLWAINLLAKYGLTAGRLTDVATVHFARWIYINDQRRLLFTSNFDGPWSAYVGDFVDRTSAYLTGIWSNTANFPPTRDLILEGAQDIDGFGWFLRINQLPTEVWYAAFRSESVITIVSTTQIAQQMEGRLDDHRLEAWLRRF